MNSRRKIEEIAVNIAVIGTGNVGGTLGRRWAQAGHQVIFGSRDPKSEKVQWLLAESKGNATASSPPDAASKADIVVFAAPWSTAQETLVSLGDLAGKTIIDCTNPLNASFDGLELGHSTSAAEEIANWAKGAHVVKAFNSVSAATMADAKYGEESASMFYCGDHEAANEIVKHLAEDLGLEAIHAGPLSNARFLEPFAMLYIHLAVRGGWGSNCAFKMMKR